MDYAGGTELWKYQWDYIHNPEGGWFIYEDSEEGAFAGARWLTPAWQVFTFNDANTVYGILYDNVPQGAIPAIYYLGKAYTPSFSGQTFQSYKYQGEEILPISIVNPGQEDYIHIYRNSGVCGRSTYYKAKWKDIKNKKGTLDFSSDQIEFLGIVPCSLQPFHDNSNCNQFSYIRPEASPDNSILRNYQQAVDAALQKALSTIPSSSAQEVRSLGVFNHLQMANSTANLMNEKQMELLEDKLHLLSYHTNIDMVVSFLKISNNTSMYDFQIDDMAQRAIEKHYTGDKKLIYMIIPFADYQSIFGVSLFNNTSCFNSGFAQSHSDIVNDPNQAHEGSTVFERIISVYKQIEKPLYIHRFFVKADKSVIEIKLTSEQGNVRGNPDIYRIEFYHSTYYYQVRSLLGNFYVLNEPEDSYYIAQLTQQIANLLEEAEQAEINFGTGSGQSIWILLPDDSDPALREVYMNHEHVVRAHFENRLLSSFEQTMQIYGSFNHTLNVEHYYNFSIHDGIASYVYGLADALSLVPFPLVSLIGDGIGFIYSTIRGDMLESGLYAAGMTMMFGSAYYKLVGNNMDNMFVVVAKRNTDDGLELVTRQVKNIGPDEIAVTPVVSTKYADADLFTQHLKQNTQAKENIGKFVKQVSGAGSWLEDLDILLGSGTKTKINIWISNGLNPSKIKVAFASSTDKAGLLNKLENSKSIYHQRVHIEDWDNIPGIVKSDYSPNGLTNGKTHAAWNNPDLDLPAVDAANFVNATAVEMTAGTKIYRVTGDNPAGAYWTIQKPNSVGDVIGGTAVQPSWNDFSKIYVYEVPQGQTLKVWQGTTAKQPISHGITNPHLPGGDQQLFIPEIVRDNTFINLVQQTTLPW